MGLTVRKIARLNKPGRYFDRDGLYLQVLGPTNKSWLLRYALRGRETRMGLGSLRDFSLEEARQRARKAHQLLADGKDPLEAKRAERAEQAAAAARNKTFAVVTTEFFDAHAGGWSPKHRSDCLASLQRYAFPTVGNLLIAAVDEPLVIQILHPLWRDKIVTGRRVRQLMASVLDFATAAGYRSGSNPARWEGHLEHLLQSPERKEVEHHAAMPYVELPGFMTELREVAGIAARALEFLILTAARSNEVRGATWEEIDLASNVWTIPASRMKAAAQHRVALSRQAVALLRRLPHEGSFVFVGAQANAAIGESAMRRLRPNVTAHGFRASFKTWSEERTNFPAIVAEQSLAHTVGSKVERAYRRGDLLAQRARLMQQWADFIDTPVAAAEVTPLRRVRS